MNFCKDKFSQEFKLAFRKFHFAQRLLFSVNCIDFARIYFRKFANFANFPVIHENESSRKFLKPSKNANFREL